MIRIALLVLSLLLMASGMLYARIHTTTPFHIWSHSMDVPLDRVQQVGVAQDSLVVRYQNDAAVEVSLRNLSSLTLQSQRHASEVLAAVYGKEPTDDPELRSVRDINMRIALEHHVHVDGPLVIYHFRYPDKEIAYVADAADQTRFLKIETRGRPMQGILDSLTRI
jgi:hypothetical protein